MSWLRRIWLLMLVLGTLVSPRLASAQSPLGLEYTLESGLGARFSATTGEFIGFIGRGL